MNDEAVIEAINDLTRVVIAFNANGTKYDAARRLHVAGVKSSRIALLLGIPLKDVTSFVSKLRKANAGRKKGGSRE